MNHILLHPYFSNILLGTHHNTQSLKISFNKPRGPLIQDHGKRIWRRNNHGNLNIALKQAISSFYSYKTTAKNNCFIFYILFNLLCIIQVAERECPLLFTIVFRFNSIGSGSDEELIIDYFFSGGK